MQPYFFPYLGYFDLIHSVDRWIVADTVQYIRHGWINRNRILSQSGDWQYIVAPVRKHPLRTPIREVEVSEAEDWRGRILKQIDHYRRRAPYYAPVRDLVEDCLSVREQSIARLNVQALRKICAVLAIRFEPAILSEMNIDVSDVAGAEELAVRLTRSAGADEYVNPPGGAGLYQADRFESVGIRLSIRSLVEFEYPCGPYPFIPHLSIVDVLMWNAPQQVRAYLDRRRD